MTIEQSLYKTLKYLTKSSNYYVKEKTPNHFIITYKIDINVTEYLNAGTRDVQIDFNQKTIKWTAKRFCYEQNDYIVMGNCLDWDNTMLILHSNLQSKMQQNIEYKILQDEEKRTEKVRKLRVKCMMNREFNAIEDLPA